MPAEENSVRTCSEPGVIVNAQPVVRLRLGRLQHDAQAGGVHEAQVVEVEPGRRAGLRERVEPLLDRVGRGEIELAVQREDHRIVRAVLVDAERVSRVVHGLGRGTLAARALSRPRQRAPAPRRAAAR